MVYVKNAWYVAGWEQDLETEKPFGFKILGQPIVIWRDKDGVLTALEDRCVHRLAPLSLGRCEGKSLRCMYHGLVFNQEGKVTEIPGQDLIPASAKVRKYPIIQKHSWLWVWMGDAEKADEALIPPAVGFDNSNFILGNGYLDYEAEANLICDNLLDFSHLTFVHANSFGSTDIWANSRPDIKVMERGVRIRRWLIDEPPQSWMPIEETVDSYSSYDFIIPGILLMWTGYFKKGTAEKYNFDAPDYAECIGGASMTSQAVTPMANQKSRYFFSWGPDKRFGDEDLRDKMMGIAGMAFGEDKDMIEAQQRIINETAEVKIMPIGADQALTLFNRLVQKLAREEGKISQAAE